MISKIFYNTAIYLRLSRDDISVGGGADINVKKAESNSISTQRDMIRSYIRSQDNMEIYDIYIDDGFSGTNFERPEFKRMMQDIKDGNVNCVIVKDLSRLGRDYIEVGRLIQKTFPAFSVRFIALTDRFDSLTADHNEISLVVPVKNFINDSYARDISLKVRSHQKIKRENGDFIGAFAVYGYKKSNKSRNRLVPDKYAADIVQKIFQWKIEGYSNIAISKRLNDMGILSPLEYKKINGENFQTGFLTGVKAKWSAVAVKRILTNENYIGTLVQGKEEKVSYKVKKTVAKPPAEWIKVQEAHEAIILKEDFYIVQDLLKIDARAGTGEKKSHMYTGLLFCGDCMEPMIRRVNRYKGNENVSFICSTKNKSGECSRHTISEKDLNNLVLTGIRQQLSLFSDKGNVLRAVKDIKINIKEAETYYKEIKRLYAEKDKYLTLRACLYEDLKKQIITEEDFKNFKEIYEKRYNELNQVISKQENTMKKLFKSEAITGFNMERIKALMQITELDRIILVTLVKRILVYSDNRIYLEMRYKELFSSVYQSGGDINE